MCGICGLVDFENEGPHEDLLEQMTRTLHHRGPDDSGVYTSTHAGLGHTRLSIIDLSQAGHQPMVSDDGNQVIVFNGEIYNFQALRRELASRGVSFHGHSDTEVVLKAWAAWGQEALARLEGMFALAIWDKRSRTLYAARDRFGIKPFYYYPLRSGLVFGSEIKAILASGQMDRAVDEEALHEYFYYGTGLGSHSLFAGVRKLLPGHLLTLRDTGITLSEFASKYDLIPSTDDEETAKRRTLEFLEHAVQSHLVSDVPVGVFLSGGIDSSTITALASRHYQGKLNTYSVGFDYNKGVNELAKARMIAEHFGTDHHELHIAGKNMPETIESLVRSHDEPFGDAADVPLYLLCQELRGSVKVILQGDGGDEIFAGYRRYNVLDFERSWHWASRLGGSLLNLLPESATVNRYKRFMQAMAHRDPAMRIALLLTEETQIEPPTRVLSENAYQRINAFDPLARYREFHQQFAHLPPVQRMLYIDCGILLPDIFLEKVDKSTMAHGIEARVPMLDTALTRYIMSLPPGYKVRRGQKKWLLRQAVRGIVPDSILDGPKTGFGVPYEWWLREPLADYMKSVLFDKTIMEWGLFDRRKLKACIQDHLSQRRNNGFLLYKLLNLSLWYRFYVAEA